MVKEEIKAELVGKEYVTLKFDKESETILLVNTYDSKPNPIKSVNRIAPMGGDVLVAQYGSVGLMHLLNSITNNTAISAGSYWAIVGLGNEVPAHIEMGMRFFPKSADGAALRDAHDPDNDLSFDMLAIKAQEDKFLFAATAIAASKDMSRIGLNLDSMAVAPEVIEKSEKLAANKRMGNHLFKDDSVPFVNYKVMHYTNISARIYDK